MLCRPTTIVALVFSAALLTGLSTSPEARAVAPSLKGGSKGGQKAAEVEELHKAKGLLERADHDYDGHREKAIEDINKAIRTLHHGEKGEKGEKGGKSEKHEPKKGEGGKEAQKKSDEQLREAVKILEEVEKHLHEKHAKGGGEHHGKAAEDVKKAIVQLDDALKKR